jgi:hypothetical protein
MGLAKAFEGWQAGLVAVVVALVGALLVVPRSVEPRDLPRLHLDRSALIDARARLDVRRNVPVSDDLQAQLFEARYRAFGRAETTSQDGAPDDSAVALVEVARGFRASDQAAYVATRDRLSAAFVDAALAWIRDGADAAPLVELAGPFARSFESVGWTRQALAREPGLDLALLALFERRYRKITLADDPLLAPDPFAERALSALMLAHPPRRTVDSAQPEETAVLDGALVLRRIDDVAKVAPEYPTLFAKGIVLYQMGRYEAAAGAFDQYLAANPRGPYRLRAINHLRAAVEATESGG